MKVLIVDDMHIIAGFISQVMLRAGHEPKIAISVSKAKSVLMEFSFDVVFCDNILMDGSGLDVATFILESYLQKQLAVKPLFVLMSGADPEIKEEDFEKYGIDLFLHKPISSTSLNSVLSGIE
jgi:DNA-binding response OmpR family regulator